jgi:hypothetical protein
MIPRPFFHDMQIGRRQLAALIAAAVVSVSHPLAAQYQTRAWLRWRTLETPHFSIHYPTELEDWAYSVASNIERVDSAVQRVVESGPTHRVNIVVDDPFRISNGSAWPFIDAPAIMLWATPPEPRDDIGTYVTWSDMLLSHEFTHIAHLTRPSRNRAIETFWKVFPVDLGPISLKAPRWMIEGYAVYVEGLVTGSGRPNGTWRPTILRQWAIEGHLPTYEQLSGGDGMYGGEFAYLGGSAFIEWLVHRRGDSSLVHLWRRMTARQDRSFDDAFIGVYGESPATLYGRFVAELTGAALEIRKSLSAAGPDSGRVIQHLTGETGDPTISIDGGRVALLVKPATRPGRIVIWKTIADADTFAERQRRQLAKTDPQDVPAIHVFPPPKRPLATLYAVASQPYQGPRFFRDGRVLVWRNSAVGDGSYGPDLYAWNPQRHEVKRLTHAANVRQGDPSPDGSTIAALRCAAGHCDLVLVDARSGRVTPLASGSDTRSFYRPRFSSDGRSILASVHDRGRWSLATVATTDGSVSFITDGGNFYDAAFVDDSTIVATAEINRIPTLVRLRLGSGALQPLVHVSGAAVGADVNPADRSVWFLALHSRGWDLRAAPIDQPAASTTTAMEPFTAHADPPRGIPSKPAAAKVGAPHRYGFGPRKWIYVPGGAWSDEGASIVAALVNSDIVGRHELLLQWQGGSRSSWQGASAALTSRATRMPWTLDGFSVRQSNVPVTTLLHGASFTIEASHRVETSFRRLLIGGTMANYDLGASLQRRVAFATLSAGGTHYGDATRSSAQVSASGASGTSAGAPVTRGTLTMNVELGPNPLVITGTMGTVRTASRFEQFTIGGLTPTLLNPAVLQQRIAMPVLPTTYATGNSLRIYRVSIPLGAGRAYSWNAKVGADSASRWERVAGLEWAAALPQISMIGTPAGRITAGIGDWLNAPRAPSIDVNGITYRPHQRSRLQLYVMTQFGDWAR